MFNTHLKAANYSTLDAEKQPFLMFKS